MEGCHLLIRFFRKLPLVRKPCRHSTLVLLFCSMSSTLPSTHKFRQKQETWDLKKTWRTCDTGSWYLPPIRLPLQGSMSAFTQQQIVATQPATEKAETAFHLAQGAS
jgi:hypothetical protein